MRDYLTPILAIVLIAITVAPATADVVLDSNYNPSMLQIEQANWMRSFFIDEFNDDILRSGDHTDHFDWLGNVNLLTEDTGLGSLTISPWISLVRGPALAYETRPGHLALEKYRDSDIYYTTLGLNYRFNQLALNLKFSHQWGEHKLHYPGIGTLAANASYNLNIAKVGLETAWLSRDFRTSYWYSPFVVFGRMSIRDMGIKPETCYDTDGTNYLQNFYFLKGFAETIQPTPVGDVKLKAGFGYIYHVHNNESGDLGWELDAGGTLKITPNLRYNAIFGYFMASDYYDNIFENAKRHDKDAIMFLNRIMINF
ncbi:MAG: hypothetical protein AMJ45_03380 [Syntrophobacter sp. DG_60]|nr:MAG: hypothetical protein AMJ45_03380 [Syntrophobacter sp. DG_60]